jgi:hypothetical protein
LLLPQQEGEDISRRGGGRTMAYHGDIYYDTAVNATTTPSPPLVLRRLDPHTAMSEHQHFFLSLIRKTFQESVQTQVAAKVGSPS